MMIKPKFGICSICKQDTEIWEGYNDSCTDCFNKKKSSKFVIDGVPLVLVVEGLLMERPLVRKIVETAILERGGHTMIRLEEDGKIYKINPDFNDQINKMPPPKADTPRPNVHPADPELIPKLNNLIDEHITNCGYCQSIAEENSVL